jgi:hypothetical protein
MCSERLGKQSIGDGNNGGASAWSALFSAAAMPDNAPAVAATAFPSKRRPSPEGFSHPVFGDRRRMRQGQLPLPASCLRVFAQLDRGLVGFAGRQRGYGAHADCLLGLKPILQIMHLSKSRLVADRSGGRRHNGPARPLSESLLRSSVLFSVAHRIRFISVPSGSSVVDGSWEGSCFCASGGRLSASGRLGWSCAQATRRRTRAAPQRRR